ncbi:peptidase domain-containing ABC transporter [Synechococcus sp. RSCCF101]|uniref:peptidase domain-containing ABC transporter n=1 Tax=Synechococcus sp. RSCCF101 TaxID=2511069 RepID=UPI0012476F24|nr:peptidase domain-containing ABC transporter [Synechococcus sp. RSCCF101]QEY31784.1 peptidase domain-containing ABC transporter [Synechococcus sp. RSCCF101]
MSSLVTLVARSGLGAGLPQPLIEAIAAEAAILRLDPGKPLQRPGQLAAQAALVVEGRLRRLLLLPGGGPQSLGLIEPGAWVGWTSIWRGEGEIGVVASQPTVLLAVPASPALALLQQHDELRQAFMSHPSPEECAELVAGHWRRSGQRRTLDPQALVSLVEASQVWPGGAAASADPLLIFSGPRTPDGLRPGAVLTPEAVQQLPARVNRLPTRVLALPRALLGDEAAAAAEPPGPLVPLRREEALSAEAPDPVALGFEPDQAGPLPGGGRRREVAGDRVGQAFFCIRQLCEAKGLTIAARRIRESLQLTEQRSGSLHLTHIGLMLEALGFDTRPLRARAWELTRLEPPAVLELEDTFVMVLLATRGGGLLLAHPEEGQIRLSISQLEQRFPDGLDLLVVREGAASRSQGEPLSVGWLLGELRRHPGATTMILITGFVGQLLDTALPISLLIVIDVVIGNNNPSLLFPIILVLLAANLVSGVLGATRALVTADLSDRVDVRLGSSVVEQLLRLPLPYFESRQVGTILYNVSQLYSLRRFLIEQLLGAGLNLVFALVILVILLLISPTLTLIILAFIPVVLVLNITASPIIQKQLQLSNRYRASASSYLVEVLSGIRTVKSQNFEVEARWRWLDRYRRFTAANFRLTRLSTLLNQLAKTLSGFADVALIGTAAVLVLSNQLSIGAIFAVRILSGRFVQPLIGILGLWQGVQEMRLSLDCLDQVMRAMPEAGPSEQDLPDLHAIRGEVRFENICFRYSSRTPLLLDGFDCTIEAGSFVGITGLSGSGKSTLVQMIDRLYLPESGHVYIDNNDVSKVRLSSLRQLVGYVPQDSLLFEGTILDNIRLNNPEADFDSVIRAARIACAHEFIQALENGYATQLGERGAGVSGGQRQRLCLARMILQNPELLILDEATSALDAATELRVFSNLRQEFAGKTVLFITHRLATLRDADRVLLMNRGRIDEDGRHEALLAADGAYATLFRQQQGDLS